MKTTKQLQALYKTIKGDKEYFTFEDFKRQAKNLLHDIKYRRVTFGLKVSRSGMMRTFNTSHHNMILNALYHNKVKNYSDPVEVGGCGMDMAWNMLNVCCSMLLTQKEYSKGVVTRKNGCTRETSWNRICSDYTIS